MSARLFAVVLMPVVSGIMLFELRGGRHISRALAITLLLAVVVLALGTFFTIGLPPVIRDIHQFANDLPDRIPGIVARFKRLPLADKLGVDSVAQKAENGLSATAEYIVASFPKWMGRIFDLVTALSSASTSCSKVTTPISGSCRSFPSKNDSASPLPSRKPRSE